MRLVLRVVQLVHLFETAQRVLVNRVVMIKIVLDEQINAPEFRQKAREKADLVHQAQDVADAPSSPEQFEKRVCGFH